jgi:hypothetical protein
MRSTISQYRRRFPKLLILLFLIALCTSLGWAQDEPLVIVQNDRYGYIDHTGKVIIQLSYIWAEDLSLGLGTVYACGHYLSIDSSGTLHPLRIALPGELEIQQQGDKVGFVDEHGQFKIKPAFDDALPFFEGMAAVKIKEKWGFVNTDGRLVIDARFENAYYFTEDVAIAELKELGPVLIDKSGKVLASNFESIQSISEGRVLVERNDKNGYLDLQGKVIIPIVYDGGLSFSEGLAPVEKDDKWGYIDRDGKLVIPFKSDTAGLFGNSLAAVKVGNRSGFINTAGEFVFELRFANASGFATDAESLGDGKAGTAVSSFWTDESHFGYVDMSGRVIWGPTDGGPDHPPLFWWTDELNTKSCEGIPESVKSRIATFFPVE